MRARFFPFLFLSLSVIFLLCPCLESPAQKTGVMTITGVVVDEDDVPMPGVAVYDAANISGGTVSGSDGRYQIIVSKNCTELVFETMGYKKLTVKIKESALIHMKVDAEVIEATVVTGIYTRKADSFTGAVQSVSADKLKQVGNKNVLESLKNIDPSLMMLENLEQGSNPNAMSSMQIRGASSLAVETTSLKSNFVSDVNMPLFILDGFETSVEKVQDMDMNRVESITILKDASAKAIYGSKGGNGVIVIETKSLDSGKTAVTYTGNISLEMPDLTSYNLCTALEKLEVERREGYYENSATTTELIERQKVYNERLSRALMGESTYWLSKPLRTGITNKHSVSVELGNKELKSFTTFSYNNNQGVMKGSFREVVTGDMNLAYRHKQWTFRNIMSISSMSSSESPYGSFSDYAMMNPYFNPYDSEGNLVRKFYKYNSGSSYISNPLYDASLDVKNTSNYLDFTDNFYVEYSPVKSLKMVARFGIDTKRTGAEEFYPAAHSRFSDNNVTESKELTKGEYTQTRGSYTSYSGDVSAQFNQTFASDHDVFATAQYTISEIKYSEVSHYAAGFPNKRLDNIIFARQYLSDSTPTGAAGLNRNLGLLLTVGYSYKSRYMFDGTVKGSASSVFGTNNRWGTFWSAGLAWNIHNEEFLAPASDWLKQLKLRFSLGSSGNQSYTTNNSLPIYQYYNDKYYDGFTGVTLVNMENPDLGWEEKFEYNLGLDFRTRHLNVTADAYLADTRNLVFSRSTLPSVGFSSVSDNLGIVRNRGVELGVNYTVFQKRSSYLTLLSKIAFNENKIRSLSESMQEYNRSQIEAAKASGSEAPVIQYYEGMPLHSIWVVPSLGIDPISGKEIFVAKNGMVTDTWSATNLCNYGSSDPLFNGNFGLNAEVSGVGMSLIFTYYGGGYKYNSTLVDMIENTSLEYNVDRRIFSNRWYYSGQIAQYRNGAYNPTKATSRFVQRNDVMNLSSFSLYYEFPYSLIKKINLTRLRASVYGSNLYTWSSIHIERGTSYPYARTVSFSLTATF